MRRGIAKTLQTDILDTDRVSPAAAEFLLELAAMVLSCLLALVVCSTLSLPWWAALGIMSACYLGLIMWVYRDGGGP